MQLSSNIPTLNNEEEVEEEEEEEEEEEKEEEEEEEEEDEEEEEEVFNLYCRHKIFARHFSRRNALLSFS